MNLQDGGQGGRGSPFPAGLVRKLAKLGIERRFDLLLHLPLRYEDETRITRIGECRPGEPCQVEGVVVSAAVETRPRRELVTRVCDDSGELWVRLLHFYPSQRAQLKPGARLRLFGEPRPGFRGMEMIHPRLRVVATGEPLPAGLTPVYPTTAGLSQGMLARMIGKALEELPLDDTLPAALLARVRLPGFAESLHALHAPPPGAPGEPLSARTAPAWRRIKFDELLAQQLFLRRARAARRALSAPALAPAGTATARLLEALPFSLTRAQRRVWAEISRELAAAHPMQRLLQGDVGSGKTVIAALAMLRAAENGWQAALMAPTEILAEQHHRGLTAWLEPLGMRIAWLPGGRKGKERRALLEELASGRQLLAVGTHALIEEAVAFARLGLAIVDEQHRFGVRQRIALREKGASPHLLMMSATPIPRTLAMSYYADLDVSVLDELPPGRTPVLTKLVSEARRGEVIARIRESCRAGAQAYWVCPLVEESEALEVQAAIDAHARLSADLGELRIGLVHGRMSAQDKSQVMEAFARAQIDLLVATTVIEVGVDVPNASVMVIESAERFGLAQLHQLRGRIGRGTRESVCVLLYRSPLSEAARSRLRVIYETGDGFEIAARDLELRGPGEVIGARQSGVPLLRFADLAADADLVEAARDAAEDLLAHEPSAAQAHLDRWLDGRTQWLAS
ncbi:MAG: ATP-dependent DNA helicase RecG [Rhodocyclaceae bacterium]